MRSIFRWVLIIAPAWLVTVLSAQTFIGNLNGSHQNSTFEGLSTQSLPAAGWTTLTGTPRIWDSTNNMLINGSGSGPFAPFSVQYVTGTAPVANTQYSLSFLMGYASATATGNANYSFSLGTWNGSVFTVLATASGGPIPYGSLESSTANGTVQSLNFITGASVSSDPLAVRWAQTNTSTSANYFGFDNVTLSASAIPEPGTYAAIAGAVALFAAGVRRRIKRSGM